MANRTPDLLKVAPHSQTDRLLARAEAAVANPFVAYGAVLLVQVRVIWNVWIYKDLTPFDTAVYFTQAASWAHGLHDDIVWSPLYTNYWGTILAAVGDVYAAAMVHRIVIVLAATLLVLALTRALLGPSLALLVTAWWAVLPPNYNVYYEVHLFALLPILVAALLVSRSPKRGYLGTSLGVLAGTTLLLRNETLIASIIFSIAILVHEVRMRRRNEVPSTAYLRAYGIPLAIVCLLIAGTYWRSEVQGHALRQELHVKHNLNVCQAYAFNYKQRQPARFPGNPFTDCRPLMQRTFGRPLPNAFQAATANPRAAAGFVKWNARLLPAGLQVALFGATSSGPTPDYIPVVNHKSYTLVLSAILLAVLAAGMALTLLDRDFWRRTLAPNAWSFLVLGIMAFTTLVVALSQRPRPEYMYALTVGVLILAGLCTAAVLRRFGGTRFVAAIALGSIAVLCLVVPSHYHRGPRPLHDAVIRLEVVRKALQRPGSVLITAGDGQDTCNYLARTIESRCISPSWAALKAQIAAGKSLRSVLRQARATVVYADPRLRAEPPIARLATSPRRDDWRQVAAGTAADGRWTILIRKIR